MVVLDTNHLREFELANSIGKVLRNRILQSAEDLSTAVVCVEELIRGRLAELGKLSLQPHHQISVYRYFYDHIETFARWKVLPWDEEAADLFVQFRAQGIRIGTMDLKIACIAMAHDALLLTRNRVDFAQVPGLRFENWLD